MLAGDAWDDQIWAADGADPLADTAYQAADGDTFHSDLSILPDMGRLDSGPIPAPSVVTDKPDYAPGTTATITAAGFEPGSTLRFDIRDDPADPGDDGDADVYEPIVVTDGGPADLDGALDGRVTTTWAVPAQTDPEVPADAFHATLLMDVVGSGADRVFGSGDDQHAATTFTDAGPEANISYTTDLISESPNDFGQALQLDGTNDYVNLASAELQFDTLTSAYTIEAWFKVDQFDTKDQTIISKGWIWSIHRAGIGDTLVFHVNGWETTSTTNVNDGNWHHVAVTRTVWELGLDFGGDRREIYIDGVLEGSDVFRLGGYAPISTNDVTALIGADVTGPSKYFDGAVDEVRVWNTVRSGFDIQRTMGTPLVGNEVGLVAYYNFDDGTAADQTANSGDGALINGPTFAESPLSPIGFVEVQLSGPVTADPGIVLNYSLSGSTAVQGTDFYSSQLDLNTTDVTPPINAIFIAKGETKGRIYFSVLPDALDESTEPITVTLTADTDPFGVGTSYTLGAATTTINIVDGQTHDWGYAITNQFGQNAQSTEGLVVDANGAVDFWVKLTSQPTSNTTMTFTVDQGSISNSGTATFTPTNWDQAQKLTVSGLSGLITDNGVVNQIATLSWSGPGGTWISSAAIWDESDNVKLKVTEGGPAQIVLPTVSIVPTANTREGEIQPGVYTVFSDVAAPAGGLRVHYTIKTGTAGIGTDFNVLHGSGVGQSSYFSGVSGWVDILEGENAAPILIEAVDDLLAEGNLSVGIDLDANAAYTVHNGLSSATVNVGDDDTASIETARLVNVASLDTTVEKSVVVDDLFDLAITDFTKTGNGTVVTVSVALKQAPSTAVTVTVNDANGTATGVLNFTAGNYNTAQTVQLTLAQAADTGLDLNVTTDANGDGTYNSLDIGLPLRQLDVPFDIDTAMSISEAGEDFSFGVRLTSKPTATVTVNLSSEDTSEGQISTALTFTMSNWNVYQVVTVVAQDDAVLDGDKSFVIAVNSSSGDTEYAAQSASFLLVNQDDESPVETVVNDVNPAPIIASLVPVAHAAGESIGAGKFKISLSEAAPTGGLTVRYVIFEDSATLADVSLPEFFERSGELNPLSTSHIGPITTVGPVSSMSLGDLDGDGDQDLLLSMSDGTTLYYKNAGTQRVPDFVLDAADNPLAGTAAKGSAMGDVDGDGDLDVIQLTGPNGTVTYFENQLIDAGSLGFIQRTGVANPFDGLTLSNASTPALVDIDNDGQLELFVTGTTSDSDFYQANGSGVYATDASNPLTGLIVSADEALNFTDWDDDGDQDVFVGAGTQIKYFENVGDASSAMFLERTGVASPADGITGTGLIPQVVDLDGNGWRDLFTVDYTNTGVAHVRYLQAAVAQEVVFAAGETSKEIAIPVVDDAIDESHESFDVALISHMGQNANVKATAAYSSLDTTFTVEVTTALAAGQVGLKIAAGEQLGSYVLADGTSLDFGGVTATVVGDTVIDSGGETLVTVTASGAIAAAATADLSVDVGTIPLIVLDPDTASLTLSAGTVLTFSDGSIFSVTESAVISQTIASDYNADGTVGIDDYTTWAANFGKTGQNMPGDGNGDGTVDAADYTVWANSNGTVVSVAAVKGIMTLGAATTSGATATLGRTSYRVRADLLTTAAFDGSTVGLKIDETVFGSFTLTAGQVLQLSGGAKVVVDANTTLNNTTGTSVGVTLAADSAVATVAAGENSSTADFFSGVTIEVAGIGIMDGFLSLRITQGAASYTIPDGSQLTFSNGTVVTVFWGGVITQAGGFVQIDMSAYTPVPLSALAAGDTTEIAGFESVSSTTLTFSDNDTAGVTLTPSGTTTSETGTTQTIQVALDTQPKDTVSVYLGVDDTEAVLSDGDETDASFVQLVFTPLDWNVAQTVTVRGVDDLVDDGDVPYTIHVNVVSQDMEYADDLVPIVPAETFNPLTDDIKYFIIDDLIVGDTTVPEGTTLTFTNGAQIKPFFDTTLSNTSALSVAYSAIKGPDRLSLNNQATVYDNFDRRIEVATAYDPNTGKVGLQLPSDRRLNSVKLAAGKTLVFSNGTEATVDTAVTLTKDTAADVSITLTQGSSIPASEAAFFEETVVDVTSTRIDSYYDNDGTLVEKLYLGLQLVPGGGASGIWSGGYLYFSNGAVGSFVSAAPVLSTTASQERQVLIISGSVPRDITTNETFVFESNKVVTADDRTNINVTTALNADTIGLQLAPHEGISSATLLAGKILRFSGGTIAKLTADVTLTTASPTNATLTFTQGSAVSIAETTFFEENLIVTKAYDGVGSIEMRIDDSLIGSLTFVDGTDLSFSNGAVAELTGQTTFTNAADTTAAVTIDRSRVTHKGKAYYQEELVANLTGFSNTDNDTAAVIVSTTDPVVAVTEGKANNYFSVALTAEPTAPVTLTMIPSDDNIKLQNEFMGEATTIDFDASNWNIAQTIEVAAVDDSVLEYDHMSTVSFAVTSPDTVYAGVTMPNDVEVFITDDDLPVASVVTVAGAIEANSPGYFVVELDGPAPSGFGDTGIVVSYTVAGTADTDGQLPETDDVQPITGTVRIAPGQTRSQLIAFPIDDFKTEGISLKVTSAFDGSSSTIALALDAAPFKIGPAGYSSGTVDLLLDSAVAGSTTILGQGTKLLFASGTTAIVSETVIVPQSGSATVSIGSITGATSNIVADGAAHQQVLLPAGTELEFAGGKIVQVDTGAYVSNAASTAVTATLVGGGTIAADSITTLQGESVTVTLTAGAGGYAIGDVDTASLLILDNDRPGLRIADAGSSTKIIEGENSRRFFVSLLSQPVSDVTIPLADVMTSRQLRLDTDYSAGATSVSLKVNDAGVNSLLLPAGTYSFNGKSVTTTAATTIYSDKYTAAAVNALGATISSTDTADYTYSEFSILNSSDTLVFNVSNWFQLQEVTIAANDDLVVETGDFHSADITFSITSEDPNYASLSLPNKSVDIIDRRFDVTDTYRSISQGFLALEDSIGNVSLPIVGDFSSVAPPFISTFLEDLVTEIRTVDNLTTDTLADAFTTAISAAIDVDQLSFEVTSIAADELGFLLTFSDTMATSVALNSDLGLEALNIGIETTGTVDMNVFYGISLGFGINTTSGFFFNTDDTWLEVSAGLNLSDNFSATGKLGFIELDIANGVSPVNIAAKAPYDGATAQISLQITDNAVDTFTLTAGTVIEFAGGSQVTVTSDTEINNTTATLVTVNGATGAVALDDTSVVGDLAGTGIDATFVVTLEDDDGELTLGEMVAGRGGANPFDFISFGFSGGAVLDLDITTSVSGNAAFPSFGFNLYSDLPLFNYGNEADAGADTAPTLTVVTGFANKAEDVATQLTLTADSDARLTKGTELTFAGGNRVVVRKTVTVTSANTVVLVTVLDDKDGLAETVTIGAGATAALQTGAFNLAFNDITLDMGEFVTDLLGPVISSINDIVDPIRPVIEVMTSEVEILSTIGLGSFFDTDGDGKSTMIEVALTLGGGLKNAKTAAKFSKFVNAITGMIALSDSLVDLENSIAAGDTLTINFGTYELQNFKGASSSEDASAIDAGSAGNTAGMSADATSQTKSSGNSKVGKFFGKLGDLGITLDVIENPLSVVQLFLGQDIDLITWDVPELDLGINIEKSFPLVMGINGLLRGGFNLHSDLVFGFDTQGLSQWKETGFALDKSYLVFDGFYLSDVDPETGEDVDELTLDATIAAGVNVSAVVASVEVVGGIQGTAGLDLIDVGEYSGESDGRIRGSEIISRISRPLDLFEIAGQVDAFLEMSVKVGVDLGFWSYMKTVYHKELARITLFEFSIGGGGQDGGAALASQTMMAAPALQADAMTASEPMPVTATSEPVEAVSASMLQAEPLMADGEMQLAVQAAPVAIADPSLIVTANHLGGGLIQYTFNVDNDLGGNVYAQISAQGGPGTINQVISGTSDIDFVTAADAAGAPYSKSADSWFNDVAFNAAQHGPAFNGAQGGGTGSNLYQFSGGTLGLTVGSANETFLGQIVVLDQSLASLPLGPVEVSTTGSAQINLVNPSENPFENSLIAADGRMFQIAGSYGVVAATNNPPAVSLQKRMIAIGENGDTSASIKVADIVVSDDGLGTNNLSLVGPDASLFEIVGTMNSTELRLIAGATLDYETNPSLDVTVVVDDPTIGGTPDGSVAYTLALLDANEAPSITSNATVDVAENQTAVIDVQSSDPDGETERNGLTYSLTGGADQSKFAIDANTGVLTFITAPDFETPGDVGANIYNVQVAVTDGGGLTDVQDIVVTVSPSSLVVNTLVDELDGSVTDGDASLRDAINTIASGGTITFDGSLAGQSIVLAPGSSELFIARSMTIDGESNRITIDADGKSDMRRVFHIDDGDYIAQSPVTLARLTITGGHTADIGAGILNRENLSLIECTIVDNSASGTLQVGPNGHLYEVVTDPTDIPWTTANTAASGMSRLGVDGHLATITSEQEDLFLYSLTQAAAVEAELGEPGVTINNVRRAFWVGGYQAPDADATDAGWQWTTGEQWTYTNWQPATDVDPTEPSDGWAGSEGSTPGIENHEEDRVAIGHLGNFGWNDAPYDASWITLGYIVEYDAPFVGDTAFPGLGGGVFNAGTVSIVSSTISGNSAITGGGIHNEGGDLVLDNSTVAGNSATRGGGLASMGTSHLSSTIIADNNAATNPDLLNNDGTVNSHFSLIENDAGQINGLDVSNVINLNPMLDPNGLQDNGGPTRTIALMGGSPAIDAGSSSGALQHDQRGEGFNRVFNGQADIGAFEFSDLDEDGVDGSVEDRAPNDGDGNGDGTADSEQDNVTSLPNAVDQEYVTLVASSTDDPTTDPVTLGAVNVQADAPAADAPEGVDFPVGFFNYEVSGVAAGAATTVTIFLPADTTVNTYYKYGPTPTNETDHWYEFLYTGTTGTGTGAEFFDDDADGDTDRVVLHYIDGQRGDDDLTANGIIVDPGAAAFQPNRPPTMLAQNFSVEENQTAVGNVITEDLDLAWPGDTLAFSITGNGADDAKFSVTAGGELIFNAAPDFENPTDSNGDNLYEVEVEVTDDAGETAMATMSVTVTNQTATISGTVFADANFNGLFDGGTETAIDGVEVKLLKLIDDTFAELATDETALGGVYAFTVDDEFATYRIQQTQPTGVEDGAAILGDANGNGVTGEEGEELDGIVESSNEMRLTLTGFNASDYDFTELGQSVQAGDTAGIGFWQNKRGQALIAAGGTGLAQWMTEKFENVFGHEFVTIIDGNGNPLEFQDGHVIASFYKNEFFKKKLKGTSKVDAQFMATALATFFTSSNLAGTVATGYGFTVTETGIGARVVNVGANGLAFGVADNTDMTIMAMLLWTNSLTGADNDADDGNDYSHIYDTNGDGILDANEKALRAMANEIYTAINEGGGN